MARWPAARAPAILADSYTVGSALRAGWLVAADGSAVNPHETIAAVVSVLSSKLAQR